jgi:DNA (cytosine-5)-methyltransferase 1
MTLYQKHYRRMGRKRALDLFSGAGGASRGLQLAGFHVTGIDIAPQPRYIGERFIQGDVLMLPPECLKDFDLIWASPPCQRFTILQNARQRAEQHPDLIGSTRTLLLASGRPYVIENVPGAPLINPKQLCGLSLGLAVKRHRLFETSFPLLVPPCPRLHSDFKYWVIAGHEARLSGNHGAKRRNDLEAAKLAMGIDWMTREELREAIPPRYAEFIGRALMATATGVRQ